jgi:UDP-N-acetylglucosamine--N-acetylmuramyl-(pentapeptide) pyrophosphoryl-undecaprenol N-acetylglucosamine transferase
LITGDPKLEHEGGKNPFSEREHTGFGGGPSSGLSREAMRVLMIAGGTGGHIFPALAVAQELRARGGGSGPDSRHYSIEFLGTTRTLEGRLIPAAGFPLRAIPAAGLKGFSVLKMLRNFLWLPRTALEAGKALRQFRPGVVVGVGGYLAGPVMLEAALRGIPTLLIEPNAVPGFTNRVLAPIVTLAAVGFEKTAHFYGSKARVTGHPVRSEFQEIPRKVHVPPFTVLVVGGSQGSRAINAAMVASIPLLARDAAGVKIIHQTGEREYEAVRKVYQEARFTADVYTFIDNMPLAFAGADLVISRAGALAVAELAAAGKASLLIPFSAATDQHQLENARVLERAGAARIIEETGLTPERLAREILDLLSSPSRLTQMEQHARNLARPNAVSRIVDLVEKLAASRG